MGQAIPEQDLDETLANVSTNPTPQQDGASVPLRNGEENSSSETAQQIDTVEV